MLCFPARDRFFRAWAGPFDGLLHAVPQRAYQVPAMIRMSAHPTLLFDGHIQTLAKGAPARLGCVRAALP
jgi:hypothetical protein